MGIPAEKHQVIFEAFQQQTARRFESTEVRASGFPSAVKLLAG
jgi:hypothetical protein